MEQEYIEKCTRDWSLEKSNGHVELWEFHDKVDWRTKFAIKVGGVVKVSFDKTEGNPYTIFEIVSKCFSDVETKRGEKMNVSKLEVGDQLMATTGVSWLIKGNVYTITAITEAEIVMDNCLHWQKSGIPENFVVVLNQ